MTLDFGTSPSLPLLLYSSKGQDEPTIAQLPWQGSPGSCAVVLCCAGAGYAASRARPSLFHKLCMPHRYRGCAHRNVGQCCISWAGVCFAVSVWFFHLGDNSYPMRDLCSMYFTTPCANQNLALNFFTTKETRTLPRWLLTGHLVMPQPLVTCKNPQSPWKSMLC